MTMKNHMTNRNSNSNKLGFLPKNATDKITLCALLMYAAISCTACGTNGADSDSAADTAESGTQQSENDTSNSNTDQSGENAEQDDIADTANAATEENDTSVVSITNIPSNIKIEMKQEIDNKSTDDGTTYFTKSYTYPIVSIEGNMDAADKINADIQSRIDSFNANTEVENWAKEWLDIFESEDSDYPFIGYSEDLIFKPIRSDSNVISFALTYDDYTGGAHGNYSILGVNYNAKTGDLLSFSDLSDDPVAFREDTLAYNQKLANTDSYQERLFSTDDITNGTLESVLYADDTWYLSTSGLVFLSNPYALGPYAAGVIEFIIPYGDLADMGFKESYAYSDRYVLKLQTNEAYSVDLNGDGSEDSILTSSEYVEDSDGQYGTVPHLIINETDFAKDGDEAMREQLTLLFSSWTDPALFDLNIDDNYIEFMLVTGEYEDDDFVYYSHFYRYMEDGSLVYLGKSKGDATDPTVEISILPS